MTTTLVRSGARAIFETLRSWGVHYVFICPGSTEAAFLDASFEYSDISLITVTHESIAVAMADGYARASGEPTVAYLHTNVGLTNGLAHLSAARIAHSPVIILNGLKPTRIQNRGGFTTAPAMRDFVRQYVKWDWVTLRVDAIGEDLNRALKIATAEPRGPTYLGIAQDFVEAEEQIPVSAARSYQVSARTRPDPDQIAAATQLLARASHPLIIAGDEVTRADAKRELIALAECIKAPVLLEDRVTLETCAFPPGHPHFIGLSAPDNVCDADVILLAGTRTFIEFDWKDTPVFPPDIPLIHLCSNADEVAKIYPTNVALVGNAKLGLTDLLSALSQEPPYAGSERQDFLHRARTFYLEKVRQADEEATRETTPLRVPGLMRALARNLMPNTVIVADAVTSTVAVLTHLLPHSERGLYTTASGSLGWGMGAALGVKLARPDEEVIALVGDGVFQFGVQALWTAMHYHIPVIFVVINNQSYAAVKAALSRYNRVAVKRQDFPATTIAGPQVAAIGQGFGILGIRVERLDELAPALQTVREKGVPAIIEVMTDTSDIGPNRAVSL